MLDNVAMWTLYADGWVAGFDYEGQYVLSLSPDEAEELNVRPARNAWTSWSARGRL